MKKTNIIFNDLINTLNKYKYTKIIIDILINWNIPYFNLLKKYLILISLFWIIIFIYPNLYKDFWEYAYNLLITILLISPLSKIIPIFKILNKILILRRSIWIIIWFFLISHLIWFFITHDISIIKFISIHIFNIWWFYFWWLWWTIFAFFPFITSNTISQKILKKKWKLFQYWTYIFFIFSVLHVYTLKWHISELLIIIIWLILKVLAYKKVVILK
jgi:DMSO/TMAO reductase YedYZ heme-binding membrane subunit